MTHANIDRLPVFSGFYCEDSRTIECSDGYESGTDFGLFTCRSPSISAIDADHSEDDESE
jgi:hypothetical protein